MNDAIRMQVSAYVDGELPDNEAELLIRRMSQDPELREEVARYLAIGRLMRAEPGLAGADRLHERVADAIEDRPTGVHDVVAKASSRRAIRPLAGAAIAASVALVAIFALQQTSVVDELPAEQTVPVAGGVVPVIDAQQERQRQYFLNHAETSSQYGANGMNSRVVTLRFSEDITQDPEAEEAQQLDEDMEPDAELVTQP
jgi:sigma-E factor negative regulatory protein RseA